MGNCQSRFVGRPSGARRRAARALCAEKLVGAAQEFSDAELQDPILRGIEMNDPIARNPCLRRGPLTLDYWTRLVGNSWRSLRRLVGAT